MCVEDKSNNMCRGKELKILISLTLLVFIIHIWHVRELNIFTVLDDEFGYWGIAAYFAGFDWSDAISKIPYYSYGYSLLLVPLLWMFDDPTHMYKAAIIINGILVSGCFLLCYDIAKKLAKQTDRFLLMGIAFLISMYPAYIAYSNIAWAECLLIFLVWLLTWCFVDLSENSPNYLFILIGIISTYLFMVHQRAIGVLIASVLAMLIMWLLEKIRLKHLMMVLVPAIILLVIHYYLKDHIQLYLWLNNEGYLANDFAAQSSKIRQIMTISGMISLLKASLGQIFYIGASSYLIAFAGVYSVIYKIIDSVFVRNDAKHVNSNLYVYVFILLAILVSFPINVIANINPTRIDHIVYGRYIESVIGPILLIGILDLVCNKRRFNRNIITNVFAFVAIAISTYYIIEESTLHNIISLHTVGLVWMNTPYGILFPSMIAILLYLFICISFGNTIKSAIALITIAALFFTTGEIVSKGIIDLNRERIKIIRTVNLISESQTNYPIYFLWRGVNSPEYTKWDNRRVLDRLIADCYQFLLKDQIIHLVSKEELRQNREDKFLISAELNELFDLLGDYTYCSTANESYLLVSSKTQYANYYKEHSDKGIRLSMNIDKDNLERSRPPGDLLLGPHKYNRGQYELALGIELMGFADDELGYVEVYSVNDEVINVSMIRATHFDTNNMQILRVPFEVTKDSEYIGVRACSNTGTLLRFNDAHILQKHN